ncbi:MAG: nucleotidyltransferase [Chitinophagaceae bacterium]|nr:nucleotidyltransferase [Chitinophagaceae bacterium]
MDVFDEELLAFWKALNDCGVKYIMVGGLSVNFNGHHRITEDLDIWLKDSVENRKNFRKAFQQIGYGDFESLETMQFLPGWTEFYVGNGIVLDVMTKMKGLEEYSFDQCLELASVAALNSVAVPFLHINHLLANKKAVARPKDLDDVRELEKIKEQRRQLGLDSPE